METVDGTRYAERLTPPWWWWVLGLGTAGLMAAEVHGGRGGLRAVLPYVVLLPLALLALASLSRGKVAVGDDALGVLDARLPHWAVGAVRSIGREELVDARRRGLDPAAFVVLRGYVPGAVWVAVDDEHDDTPYWLFSTRHPERLAAALAAAAGLPPPPR